MCVRLGINLCCFLSCLLDRRKSLQTEDCRKIIIARDREVAQQFTALAEDLGFTPSTNMTTHYLP